MTGRKMKQAAYPLDKNMNSFEKKSTMKRRLSLAV